MELQLTGEEADLLREVLTWQIGEVREEVYKSDDSDYRQLVKSREALLKGILSKVIAQTEPAPTSAT